MKTTPAASAAIAKWMPACLPSATCGWLVVVVAGADSRTAMERSALVCTANAVPASVRTVALTAVTV